MKQNILSANRKEKKKHQKRMRKLESLYKQNLDKMKNTLETKLENAATSLEDQQKEQQRRISGNQEQQNIKKEKTAKMRRELEDGLEKWGKQILEVQDNNIKRAENQAEHKKKSRRDRSREERRGRERRIMERRKQSKEREDENLKLKRIAIETKDKKAESFLKEREQSIERQRRLAAKSAQIRRTMRSQSCSSQLQRRKIEATI